MEAALNLKPTLFYAGEHHNPLGNRQRENVSLSQDDTTTRLVMLFLSIFEYIYIRWRVSRSVSIDIDQDDDSLASSSDESIKKKIIRTSSLYNVNCPSSLRNQSACQRPGCIDLYRQFMSYGSTDHTTSGHILLANSASYFAIEPTYFCKLSLSENANSKEPSLHWSEESDVSSEIDSGEDEEAVVNTCNLYQRWILCGSGDQRRPRRVLPATPEPSTPESVETSEKSHLLSFESYFQLASMGSELMTYSEEQRQVRNYFFTSPTYFENDENRQKEERRLAVERREVRIVIEEDEYDDDEEVEYEDSNNVNPPIIAVQLHADSYENVYLRQQDEDYERDRCFVVSDSYSSDFASTAIPEASESENSDYLTASVSSPAAKEISTRFSNVYWRVDNQNGDGANGARDNYHNRYFGKAGYHLTRNAIVNQADGRDTMPSVEKRALQNERRRWTEINQRGGRDDNAILEVPDTNGIYTNCWETEYEQPLPPHTCVSWKTAKAFVFRSAPQNYYFDLVSRCHKITKDLSNSLFPFCIPRSYLCQHKMFTLKCFFSLQTFCIKLTYLNLTRKKNCLLISILSPKTCFYVRVLLQSFDFFCLNFNNFS
eukprot:NP_508155.2 Uncharacterized protein CELE_T04G9.6 [Caenorhabditis elegans]